MSDAAHPIHLSVLIPVYNEAGNVVPLHSELDAVLRGIGLQYELTNRVPPTLLTISRAKPRSPITRAILSSRSSGIKLSLRFVKREIPIITGTLYGPTAVGVPRWKAGFIIIPSTIILVRLTMAKTMAKRNPTVLPSSGSRISGTIRVR